MLISINYRNSVLSIEMLREVGLPALISRTQRGDSSTLPGEIFKLSIRKPWLASIGNEISTVFARMHARR